MIKLSTPRALTILMVDADDGTTEETGLTLTITVRKSGSSTWSAGSGSTTERGNGSYEYTPTSGEVNTAGDFELRAAAAGARTFRLKEQVVAALPGENVTVGAVAAGAIDSGAIADGAITAPKLASGAITSAKIAAGAITSGAFATDAIDANAVAATAVADIQSGLATAANVAAVEADTQDIQARLPAALVSGRIDASVGAMAAGTVTAAAIATGAIDADAIAGDAGTELAAAVDAALSSAHGAGAWGGSGGATAGEIADAICDEALAGHATAGTVGAALTSLLAGVAALPSAAAVATAVWDFAVEGSHTARHYLRIAVAALAGRHTGTTGSNVFYSPVSTSTPRVTATVASDGTRGNPTIDGA